MKSKFYILIIVIISSCSIGRKQVFFNEMFFPPIIELTKNGLIIKTENSKENSALLIYSIETEIDLKMKEIKIKGFQAAGKKFRDKFNIELKKEVIENIKDYKIFWLDPDNKMNELKIKNAL